MVSESLNEILEAVILRPGHRENIFGLPDVVLLERNQDIHHRPIPKDKEIDDGQKEQQIEHPVSRHISRELLPPCFLA